jgi:DNA-binding GntR family transcriptional regulator
MFLPMPMVISKLATSTLRRQIVQQVRQAILSGSLRPGERLVERDLASRFGTSLTAVREAMIQLESEGLITKRPNSTTHVTELSADEIGQISVVRQVLEEYAFAEAARLGTPAEIAALDKLHQEAMRSARAGDASKYIEQDLEWHEAVWQMAKNQYLYENLERAILPLFGFSIINVAGNGAFDLVEDARSHKPLLNAIAAHNRVAVRKLYRSAAELWNARTWNLRTPKKTSPSRRINQIFDTKS